MTSQDALSLRLQVLSSQQIYNTLFFFVNSVTLFSPSGLRIWTPRSRQRQKIVLFYFPARAVQLTRASHTQHTTTTTTSPSSQLSRFPKPTRRRHPFHRPRNSATLRQRSKHCQDYPSHRRYCFPRRQSSRNALEPSARSLRHDTIHTPTRYQACK